MIARVWRGWTTAENADAYERLLIDTVLPGIRARHPEKEYRGASLMRRTVDQEVEFMTILTFETMEAVRAFAGPTFDTAVIYPAAVPLLIRYDDRSTHYMILSGYNEK